MTTQILYHTVGDVTLSKPGNCEYCSNIVTNCLCEIFKRINDRKLPYDKETYEWISKKNRPARLQNKLFELLTKDTKGINSHTLESLSPSETLVGTSIISFSTGSNKTEQQQNQIGLRNDILVNSNHPNENTNINSTETIGSRKALEHPKNLFEIFLGEYCPIWLRKNKNIDYDDENYKLLQIRLAKKKILEQEGKLKTKRVYNPCNKYVFWLWRPFNFDYDYRYSMFCEKALERRSKWKKYHDGIQTAPRKHFFRRWLNRKWEWESIIDFIFEELEVSGGETILDNRTLDRKSRKKNTSQKKRNKVEPFSSHYVSINDIVYDYSDKFNSRGPSLIEEVFNSLVNICESIPPEPAIFLKKREIRTA